MPTTVAVAGVGSLGKYICEEFQRDSRFDVVVIKRQTDSWLDDNHFKVYISDYSADSTLEILNTSKASVLISTMNCPPDRHATIHTALLNACTRSETCKRFIPSEWAGNIDDFPHLPRFYASSRLPFRKELSRACGVECTLVNIGWLMDWFLPARQTYMPPIPDLFPIDANSWTARIVGTGDEPQSWTCARDVGKAVVELVAAPAWEPVTYIAAEWSTWNEAVKVMNRFYGRSLPISYTSAEDLIRFIEEHASSNLTWELEAAHAAEWGLAGASAVPRELTLRQREKYFSNISFSGLEDLLHRASATEFV